MEMLQALSRVCGATTWIQISGPQVPAGTPTPYGIWRPLGGDTETGLAVIDRRCDSLELAI